MTISPDPTIETASLPGGTTGIAYSATLQASGGTGTLKWTASGNLPSGLSINASSGVISGTPTSPGTFTFTVEVTDSASSPVSAQKQLSITIVSRTLVITTTSLPDGTKGVAYSATLEAAYANLPVS